MDWYGEHLSHPQLLAYLAALDEDVRAVATVNVGVADLGFHGIAAADGVLPKVKAAEAREGMQPGEVWRQSRDLWKARIEALVRDFVGGRAAGRPGAEGLQVLRCRVACAASSIAPPCPRMRNWSLPRMIEQKSTATDERAREEATDPTRSIVLQAPAGSGKTTVLTARFMRLLESVDEPEEILAVTFTRKAAAAMRVSASSQALTEDPPVERARAMPGTSPTIRAACAFRPSTPSTSGLQASCRSPPKPAARSGGGAPAPEELYARAALRPTLVEEANKTRRTCCRISSSLSNASITAGITSRRCSRRCCNRAPTGCATSWAIRRRCVRA